jgi:ADP-ribose diphosphatase
MKILSSKPLFTSRYFKVIQNTIERDGKTFTKDFVKRNSITLIIPYTADNELYMEKQFRDALGEDVIEFPAGQIEGDDDPLETAKRELKEEAGLTAKKWDKLAEWQLSANMDAKIYVYAATELQEGEQELEFDEEITLVKMPLTGLSEKIEKGEMKIASHIAAALLFERLRTEGKL